MSRLKILILTGDAAESLEVMYPYQRLREEGYDVKIAAPSKKKLHFVVHDFEPGFDTYTEKPGYSWDADLSFAEVNPSDYVALVVPEAVRPNTFAMTPTVCVSSRAFSSGRCPLLRFVTRRLPCWRRAY